MFDKKKLSTYLYKYEDLERHIEQISLAITRLEKENPKHSQQCMLVFERDEAGVYVSNEFALPIFRDELRRANVLLQTMSAVLEKTGL